MPRLRARKDRNHNEISDVFERAGFRVCDTSQLGGGFPDIVIARNGKTALVEIKDGERPPSERRLTKDEAAFRDYWDGAGRWCMVECYDDAMDVIRDW